MKKVLLILAIVVPLAIGGSYLLLKGIIIQNPAPSECEVRELVVSRVYEGGVKDIVFANEDGEFYYINRGLERGLTLEGMSEQVLNKKATLHLAKVLYGSTSNHIAQLAVEGEVLFTEFN
jgi:hypothetical protein